MKRNLIKTDNYLLVVDESVKEINNGEYFLLGGKHVNMWAGSGSRIMTDLTGKIISHAPLNGAPYLDGVDLLPPSWRDNGVEEEAEQVAELLLPLKGSPYRSWVKMAILAGYKKAREKYKYTEEDARHLIMYSFLKGVDRGHYSKEIEDRIIQTIQQPKLPIAFECEMEPKFKHIGSTKEVKGSGSKIKNKHAGNPKTIINSEGRTEWVGKWIFEQPKPNI